MNSQYKPRNAGAYQQPKVSKLEVFCTIALTILLIVFGTIVPVLVITDQI